MLAQRAAVFGPRAHDEIQAAPRHLRGVDRPREDALGTVEQRKERCAQRGTRLDNGAGPTAVLHQAERVRQLLEVHYLGAGKGPRVSALRVGPGQAQVAPGVRVEIDHPSQRRQHAWDPSRARVCGSRVRGAAARFLLPTVSARGHLREIQPKSYAAPGRRCLRVRASSQDR